MRKDKTNLIRAFMCPAILIGVCCGLFFSGAVGAAPTFRPKAEIVWSEVIDGNNQIFYSALMEDNLWRPKIQLSQSDDINAAPAISSGNDGRTWVVWAAVDGMTSRLFYTYFDGTQWSDPEEMPSPLASNVGASIAFDQDNTLWVWDSMVSMMIFFVPVTKTIPGIPRSESTAIMMCRMCPPK